jgi:thioredoxin reductase (NADPH)
MQFEREAPVAKITILAVDDDRVVLNAVERDLRQQYGREYRILKADSGEQALEAIRTLKSRGEAVALFVVDQRMPHLTGIQFLEQAQQLFPEARKVLLTAYADTEAAIQAINKVGIDYYLIKPWEPPQEHFYPVLDSLLEDWKVNTRLPFEGLRVVGSLWSPACHDAKDFLARNAIPYQWLDIDHEPEARRLLDAAGIHQGPLPVIFFPDGSLVANPSPQVLAQKTGLSVQASKPFYDVVVIGGGPAGLSAAVIASSDGLRVLLIERQAPGGQAGNSPKIENYLGFPSGISGADLTRRAVTQARRFGAEIITAQEARQIRCEGNTRIVTLADGSEVSAKIVLIATGAWFRTLPLPDIERWHGAGVYYGASHIEAVNFIDEDAIIIGGANSAAQSTLHLARYARKVTVLVRGKAPEWSKYLAAAIQDNPKIEILCNTELQAIHGENNITSITVRNNQTGEQYDLPTAAIFVFIGQKPQSDYVADLVMRSPSGHILTGLDLLKDGKRPPDWTLLRDPLLLETSVPGIFAAGDVRNGTKHGVAAATGDGNAAVSVFWQYLSTI